MLEMYDEHEDAPVQVNEEGPTVILMVGVNGSGKTTTAAKLTRAFQEDGKSVVWLAAADTFRAGAVDQLARWGRTAQRALHQGAGKTVIPARCSSMPAAMPLNTIVTI